MQTQVPLKRQLFFRLCEVNLVTILISNKHKREETSVSSIYSLQSESHEAKNAPLNLGTGSVKLPTSGKSACTAFYIQRQYRANAV